MKGFWRGIFVDLFDTDRPHTHPWEMLGFAEKPDWWEGRYGAAPYTAGNDILWNKYGFLFWNSYNINLSYICFRYSVTHGGVWHQRRSDCLARDLVMTTITQ